MANLTLDQCSLAERLSGFRRVDLPFADFVERTVNFKLHSWQRDYLCPMLQRCRTEKGLRIAMHGPPQFGKSIVASQRLPADLIGRDPKHRVGLACYNETHATGFGQVIKDLMLSPEFQAIYGDLGIRPDAPAGRFFTSQRKAEGDAQPSFLAMGLLSGFTGKGVDTLIIDDPYASAEDARSEAINEKVWRWWAQTAGVRISEEANVIVMFHRYHEDDFAGRLLSTGKFEYVRFPAIADDNLDGSDPTGRNPGELLSPMRSREWLQAQEDADPKTFLGQFQGKPRPDEGQLFQREYFRKEPSAPKLDRWVRFWDLATKSDQTGDFTAGALVGIGPDHTIYLRDMVRFRAEWPEACETIVAVTSRDSLNCQREGADYQVGVEKVAWMQPMIQDLFRKAIFDHVPLVPVKPKGKKKERASGWAARARFDKFRYVEGQWDQQAFIKECLAFDGLELTHDDQVDAVSGGYELLWHLKGGFVEEPKPLDWNSRAFLDKITGDDDDGWD